MVMTTIVYSAACFYVRHENHCSLVLDGFHLPLEPRNLFGELGWIIPGTILPVLVLDPSILRHLVER